jgi:hypothetical protein
MRAEDRTKIAAIIRAKVRWGFDATKSARPPGDQTNHRPFHMGRSRRGSLPDTIERLLRNPEETELVFSLTGPGVHP